MGGTSSTQGRWLENERDADDKDALSDLASIAYKNKGGDGVATAMAIANKTDFKMVYVKEESFSGRWEQDPPGIIEPNKAKAMVHRKRDGSATGSSGYVEYALQNQWEEEVCKVFFGWDTPWSGKNTVGCGWMTSDKEMDRSNQEKVGHQQSNAQRIACKEHSFEVKIEIKSRHASPKVHLVVERKAFTAVPARCM